jgi:hypothetical protein
MTTAPWFDVNALAWIDPGLGILEAAWGGAVGLLAYHLVRKGRARGFVYAYLWGGLIAAVLFLCSGALALVSGQPTMISVSLIALGSPLLVAAVLSLINVKNAYRTVELRRMQAQEL